MRVVVMAPHPDDEAIGCGGMIWKHHNDGDDIHIVYMTEGELGGDPAKRLEEASKCASVLGLTTLRCLHLPDGAVSSSSKTLVSVRSVLTEIGPQRIYYPHRREWHMDHKGTALAVERAYNALGWEGSVELWAYEVGTPLQEPNHVMDITAEAGMKRAAIRCYKSQIQNSYDEAALALNRFRGILLGPNVLYCECFSDLRESLIRE